MEDVFLKIDTIKLADSLNSGEFNLAYHYCPLKIQDRFV